MATLSPPLHRLFWNLDLAQIDPDVDVDTVLARVLERGDLDDVRWVLERYGEPRVLAFFRAGAHPDVGRRTREFWRAWFVAGDEQWQERRGCRIPSDERLWSD